MRPFAICLALAALLFPRVLRAENPDGIYAGLGVFFQNMLKVSSGSRGERALLGEVYFPELQLGYRYGAWFPALSFKPISKRAGDGDRRRSVLRLHLPYEFAIPNTPLALRAGGGLLVHRLHGDGGAVELRNAGNLQTFYVPSETRTLRIFYLSAGLGLALHPRWISNLDLLVSGPLSRRRAVSLSLGGGYVF